MSQSLPGSAWEILARWGRSCRDPRESQFSGGCSLSCPLGTLGRRRAGRDGGICWRWVLPGGFHSEESWLQSSLADGKYRR